jgi:phage shock protein A
VLSVFRICCRLLQSAYDALLAEEEALAKEIAEEEKQRQAQLAAMREKMGAAHDEL